MEAAEREHERRAQRADRERHEQQHGTDGLEIAPRMGADDESSCG